MNYTPLPLYKFFAMDAYILHKATMLITHHVSLSHGFYGVSRYEKGPENGRLASSERKNGEPKK